MLDTRRASLPLIPRGQSTRSLRGISPHPCTMASAVLTASACSLLGALLSPMLPLPLVPGRARLSLLMSEWARGLAGPGPGGGKDAPSRLLLREWISAETLSPEWWQQWSPVGPQRSGQEILKASSCQVHWALVKDSFSHVRKLNE